MIHPTQKRTHWLWGPLTVGFIMLMGLLIGWSRMWSDGEHRKIISHDPITRIDMLVVAPDPQPAFNKIIVDTHILNRIDLALRSGKKLFDAHVRDHDAYIKMKVYKGQEISMQALRTRDMGWIYNEGDDYYKNDSLAAILQSFCRTSAN